MHQVVKELSNHDQKREDVRVRKTKMNCILILYLIHYINASYLGGLKMSRKK
jgi:hypothetical protein